MAKRRRIKKAQPTRRDSTESDSSAAVDTSAHNSLDPMCIAVGLLGGTLVYVSYYPSDSVAVEAGDALWFGALAIVIAAIVWSVRGWGGLETGVDLSVGQTVNVEEPDGDDSISASRVLRAPKIASRLLDIVPWLLAAWMMLAAFASSPPGNLRMATNEAWLWVSAAALFTAARSLMRGVSTRRAMVVLIVVCASGLAVHGLHQYYVSLPDNRLAYEQDPDWVLEMAGVDAPEGSSERMVFENRLYDGGPTGTFALANSLAAVLLVGVVLAIGVLRFHWLELRPSGRVLWGLSAFLCSGCLMAARSRSATLAMLVGVFLIFVVASRLRARNPKALVWGLGGVTLASIALVVCIARLGNREWLAQAPASLAFRFQYWRATWQMALDHPLLAAGPGNFQSIYERYREASATEQIAEPHNLFFETLSSGGFIGLGLLLLTIVSGFVWVATRPNESTACDRSAIDSSDRWLWLGAALSVLMVWIIGWVSRHTPDVQATFFVLPTSILAAVLLWPSVSSLASRDLDSILGVALIAITIHLMVAGGWTVPGVAIVFWLCSAMLARSGSSTGTESRPKPAALALAAGCSLTILAALYFMSLRPVEARKQLMAAAARAQSTGQLGKAKLGLQRAVGVDPWSPDAALWVADFYRWKIILGADNPVDRQQWNSSLSQAKQRAGDDPAVYRMIGAQQLHVYQRHGNAVDLEAAAETFQMAVDWSPSNQWMIAQMAVVAQARGEMQKARMLGNRALDLSLLGGNIERALSRQQVYVARPLGKSADRGPIRRGASELLSEPATH